MADVSAEMMEGDVVIRLACHGNRLLNSFPVPNVLSIDSANADRCPFLTCATTVYSDMDPYKTVTIPHSGRSCAMRAFRRWYYHDVLPLAIRRVTSMVLLSSVRGTVTPLTLLPRIIAQRDNTIDPMTGMA